jgi:hypothetical protein
MLKKIIIFLVMLFLSRSPLADAEERSFFSKLPKLHGFLEEAYGVKFGSDATRHERYNLAEARLQLKTNYYFTGDNILSDWRTSLTAKSDFLVDLYSGGKVITQLRELNALFTPIDMMDVKIGRQVLTWGTGDYLFLNDLFPKDYVSFFIGRDDEYLKKPNDALRVMLYPSMFNLDLVAIPFFEPNDMPRGRRVSFFDPFQGGIAGMNSHRLLKEPAWKGENFVYAARVYKNIKSYETALYYYRGFDPAPRSYRNEQNRELYYERLDAYGASVRGPFLWGIANAEASFYYSPEDPHGDIRTVQNSMMKYLIGYDKDLGHELSMSFQYYVEQTLDYEDYREALLPGDYKWAQFRHVITNRITKTFANQTVKFTLFSFFSPSDMDAYIRPSLSWSPIDAWTLTVGANLPYGRHSWTEFGSVRKNKNVYARLRYSF